MNAEQTRWSRRYQAALQKHLKQGPKPSLEPALRLGRRAAALGLDTLALVRIHDAAIAALRLADRSSAEKARLIKRARQFFAETITPIEGTHHAARDAGQHVEKLTAELSRCTSGLNASKQRLKRQLAQRKSAEKDLRQSDQRYAKLVSETRALHKELGRLTHQILAAQEHGKTTVSHALQDEIAQTLLGINVRLLRMRKGVMTDAHGLKKEIASMQRLVGQSLKFMSRYTHELGKGHET